MISGGENKAFPNNKVIFWNDETNEKVGEILFKTCS
jgi:hypothetical protein